APAPGRAGPDHPRVRARGPRRRPGVPRPRPHRPRGPTSRGARRRAGIDLGRVALPFWPRYRVSGPGIPRPERSNPRFWPRERGAGARDTAAGTIIAFGEKARGGAGAVFGDSPAAWVRGAVGASDRMPAGAPAGRGCNDSRFWPRDRGSGLGIPRPERACFVL